MMPAVLDLGRPLKGMGLFLGGAGLSDLLNSIQGNMQQTVVLGTCERCWDHWWQQVWLSK